jgi:RNA polymerase sigma-70 factor, ECF subfamily
LCNKIDIFDTNQTMSDNLEQSFVKQLKENQNIIHKICRLYTNGQDAHNDLFQEITIQLWKAFPKFRGDSKFSTWAYRVALNTAITLYRKSTRSVSTTTYDGQFQFINPEDYNNEEEEQIKLMYQAVQQLNDIEKALVFLYLEDKDYTEISETLGISEVNARVKMNRIKGKLKKILNP